MNIKDPRHDLPIWNSGCAALMCIIFTALLIEAGAVQMQAGPGLRLALALLFLTQSVAIVASIRPYRSGAMSGTMRGGRRIGRADIACVLFLAALGGAGSAWLRTGWALPAALFATLLCVFPWSRIPLCRSRLPLAGVLTLLGGAAFLPLAHPVRSPLFLLIPAWILWLAGCGAWLRLILLKQRKSRALAAYPASG